MVEWSYYICIMDMVGVGIMKEHLRYSPEGEQRKIFVAIDETI